MLRRWKFSLLLFALSLTLISCSAETKAPYSHAELVLPLTEDFYAYENESFDASFTNGTVTAAILRISFTAGAARGIPDYLTAKQFGAYWLDKTENGAYLLTYETLDYCGYTEEGIYHLAAFYRSRHAYFVLLFAAPDDMFSEWQEKFLGFASGVYFTD